MPAPNVVAPAPTMTREVTPMGPGFGAEQLRETDRSASGAGERHVRRASWQSADLGSASVVPPTVQLGAGSAQRSMAGGMGSGQRRGASASLGRSGRLAHRPGPRKSWRRIWRSARRGRGCSATQQQWRWKRLRRGGFQPAGIESRDARQWRQRRSGDVSGWR